MKKEFNDEAAKQVTTRKTSAGMAGVAEKNSISMIWNSHWVTPTAALLSAIATGACGIEATERIHEAFAQEASATLASKDWKCHNGIVFDSALAGDYGFSTTRLMESCN